MIKVWFTCGGTKMVKVSGPSGVDAALSCAPAGSVLPGFCSIFFLPVHSENPGAPRHSRLSTVSYSTSKSQAAEEGCKNNLRRHTSYSVLLMRESRDAAWNESWSSPGSRAPSEAHRVAWSISLVGAWGLAPRGPRPPCAW